MNKMIEKETLLDEISCLQKKHDLSKTVSDTYYEPGMMENLEQYAGEYDPNTGSIRIRTEVKGLRYEGRTEKLEKLSIGQEVRIVREKENRYNPNNFTVLDSAAYSLGNLPASLCNAMAPLFDRGNLRIESAFVSYLERIRDRCRYAKQGVLFVEISMRIQGL